MRSDQYYNIKFCSPNCSYYIIFSPLLVLLVYRAERLRTCKRSPVSPQRSTDRWVRCWAVPLHQSSQEHKHVCPAHTNHVPGTCVWGGKGWVTNFMTQDSHKETHRVHYRACCKKSGTNVQKGLDFEELFRFLGGKKGHQWWHTYKFWKTVYIITNLIY